jgi:hypothetical protein
MRRLDAVGLLALFLSFALLLTGCPLGIPALKTDLGAKAVLAQGAVRPALHLTTGASAAGFVERPIPFDFGAGYLLSARYGARSVHGLYVDGAYLLRRSGGWSYSFGGRAELLMQERAAIIHTGWGAAVRFAGDPWLYKVGKFSSSDSNANGASWMFGEFFGNLAVGFAVELGVRRLPGAVLSWDVMLGLTFRLPAVIGALLFVPFPR